MWERLCRVRVTMDQFEGRAERPEFSLGNKCEVDLHSAGKEEHTIDPGSGRNIVVVKRFVPIIHKPAEIGQHGADLARISNSKRKIDV
jgi:hypothetical protein